MIYVILIYHQSSTHLCNCNFLQVHEKDGLPHHICLVCVDKLKQCYETIIAFFAAEAFFRSQVFTEDVTSNGNGDFSDFDVGL